MTGLSRSRLLWPVALALWAAATPAAAHHSFAVFFDDQTIAITGTVTEFRFTNPHGLISLTVSTAEGPTEQWVIETNAQTLLRRRGWTKETLVVGEVVTVDGWLARDGTKYLRMRGVTRADGTVLFGPAAGRGTGAGAQ